LAAALVAAPLVALPAAPAGAAAAPARITWSPCPEDETAQCGTLRVPIDWDRPRGEKFDLAIARRPATDPAARIGSLLINPGGPGGSAREFAIFGADYFSAEIRRHFDIVGVDPRGVGQSSPVMCSTALLLQEPVTLPGNRAEYAARLDFNKRLRDDCRSLSGPIFDHADSLSNVRDMDAVRAALGDRKLTYYGISYGTMLAQQYAEMFPGRVRAIVSDSNMDHSLGTRGFLDTEAASAQDAFDEFVAWCDRSADCELHGRDVRAVWHDVLDRAARGEIPYPPDPTRPLRPDELINFAFGAFYGPDWAVLAEVLALLDAGEEVPAEPEEPPGELPEAVPAPGYAIFCSDWRLPLNGFRDFAGHLRRSSRIAPEMLYSPPATQLTVACQGQPRRIPNPQHRLRVRDSNTPLLLLNALHDPATGYNWGANAARQLGREAVLLTYEGWGHGVYGRSECTTTPVDRYLIELAVPANGTRCPAVEPGGVSAQRRALPGVVTAPDLSGREFPY
jgi:pimeloyl-ACP methyl ester carboxylesterase